MLRRCSHREASCQAKRRKSKLKCAGTHGHRGGFLKSFAHWLSEIGLESYAAVFSENKVDFDVLRLLNESDLRELGIALGDRKRILQAVAKLESADAVEARLAPVTKPASTPAALSPTLESTEGERRQLTVMLYEDLHWADPTTLEVLDLLIDRVRAVPLLIVLTHRPEFQPKWGRHGHVTSLNLSKLTRGQSSAIVSKLSNSKALPSELLDQILSKTDGVPLYVEELTKAILESGELKDAGDHYDYVGITRTATIPTTLRDSLMARLDRSPAAKEIAQIGAAIGREFSSCRITIRSPRASTPKT